jgi:hypothetical protein
MPRIFHFSPLFLSLQESKLATLRLLLDCFHVIQNLQQATPNVGQTSFEYFFKQTYLMRRSTFTIRCCFQRELGI